MKIHIVQKGDTLWEIAKEYGVDFEELKQLNSHLSSPDMIMPGMKIRIPSEKKAVKEKSMKQKKEQPMVEHPYKEVAPKPLQSIKEDDQSKPTKVKAEMPMMPTMPSMPHKQEMPKLPPMPVVPNMPTMPMEVKKEMKKPLPEKLQKVKKEEIKPMPDQEVKYEQVMVPVCCHVIHSCCKCQPMHHHYQGKGQMNQGCHSPKSHMHHQESWNMRYDEPQFINNPVNEFQGGLQSTPQPSYQPAYPTDPVAYQPHFAPYQGVENGLEQSMPFPQYQAAEQVNYPYPIPPHFQPLPTPYKEIKE